MTVKTKVKKTSGISSTIDSSKLLKAIKTRSDKLTALENQYSMVRGHLFLDVHHWVTIICGKKQITTTEAFDMLATEVRRSRMSVNIWYYSGMFMQKHKLDPESVDHRLISRARNCQNKMDPPKFSKVLKAIKAGVHPAELTRLINLGADDSGYTMVKMIKIMKQRGQWNKKGMKRMLSMYAAVAAEYFWDDSLSLVLHSDADRTNIFDC